MICLAPRSTVGKRRRDRSGTKNSTLLLPPSVEPAREERRDRSRQANLARVLSGVDVDALDDVTTRRVGELLRQNRSDDLVDAHVALLVQLTDQVLTSDEPDIKASLRTRKVRARIVPA